MIGKIRFSISTSHSPYTSISIHHQGKENFAYGEAKQVLGTVQFCPSKNLFFLRCDQYSIPWVTRQTPYQLLLHSQHFTQGLNTPGECVTCAAHEVIARHTLTHTLRLQTVLFQLLRERSVQLAEFSGRAGPPGAWVLCVFGVTLPVVYPKAESSLRSEHSSHCTVVTISFPGADCA